MILGGGPSGLTAAIFAGQASLNPLVIQGEQALGQYPSVNHIENFPGFPKGISGLELNLKLEKQAEKWGAKLHQGRVAGVDFSTRPFSIELSDGVVIQTESVIVATGSSPKWLGLESEKEWIGRGISANALLDGPSFSDQEVIVIGAGDAAMEQALLLTEHASQVTIICKGNAFFAAQYLQDRVFAHPKINILFGKQVIEILAENDETLQGVLIQDVQTKEVAPFACRGIFVAQGRRSNTDFLKGKVQLSAAGDVVTLNHSTQASVTGVFIAGDIAEHAYRRMVTAAASGSMAALDAIKFLKENK